jgi:serine phosphatase RsbU (regulator of sigma subunit)
MQKKGFYLLALLLACFLLTSAQEFDRLDSLLIESEKGHVDSIKVDILNSIAWEYRNSEMEKVKVFSDSALLLAEKINYPKGQVKSHFNIGNMYYIKGDFSLTLESYLRALSILEKVNDRKGIASALMGVGNIHAIQKNKEKAIEYQEKSLAIRIEIGDSMGIAASYNNLGSIYMELNKNLDKALEYNLKSLAIKEALKYWKGMSSSYGNIGAIYKEQGKLKEALEYQGKALEIRKKLNNRKGMVMSYTDVGNIYHELKQYKKALENQKKALDIAKEVSYKEGEVMALISLSITSEKLKQFDNALDYYKTYTEQKDSLFSIKKSKEIADMESVYTAEKQKQQIIMLEKDNLIQDLKINSQEKQLSAEKAQRIAMYSVLSLVICFVFFLIYTVIKRKKANQIIAHQKELVEEKNREITDSITYAKRIQKAILPTKKEVKEWLPDSFIFYKPKDIVAGDFYWMDQQDEYLLFAAADCTGHGVPGAMVSVVCHTAMNRVIREHKLLVPGEILDKTSEIVVEQLNESNRSNILDNIRDGMDIALCTLNTKTNELQYAGANNPLWVIRNNTDEVEEIIATKQAIGIVDNPQPYKTHNIKLAKGDAIYVFSDGFPDQFGGPKGKKFMYKSFKKLLVSISKENMDKQHDLINNTYKEWVGNLDQVDDICIIGIRI